MSMSGGRMLAPEKLEQERGAGPVSKVPPTLIVAKP